ncbi:MAG: hypothetical protein IJA86_07255, partial [Clostridia bacterium]|nr:hypothetical protein [Clostridia bacterium]
APLSENYYGHISAQRFLIAEKPNKNLNFGSSHNSFAPVLSAKITEKDGISIVTGILRMNMLVMFLFIPIYLLSILTIITFPFMYLLMYFAFIRPANRLKEHLILLIAESEQRQGFL